jgi:hypothetical protein
MANRINNSAPWNSESVTATGTSQATATQIPVRSSPALIVAAGDDVVGIKLPPATKGKVFVIKNTGTGGITGKLNVYPSTGNVINALSANAPIAMASLSCAMFIAKDTTTWYTCPTLPS